MESRKTRRVIGLGLVAATGVIAYLIYGFSWGNILPWLALASVLSMFIRFRSYRQFFRWLKVKASYF